MKQTKDTNRKTLVIILTYIVLAASVGVFFPFNALYLSSTLGFSNTQISFIDGFGQLGAMFLLPVVGIISDKIGRPGWVFIVLMLLSGVLLLFYANMKEYLYVVIIYISYLSIRRGIFPLLDALTLNHCSVHNINFGIFRSIYSGTYMVAALMIGFFFNNQMKIDNSFIYFSLSFNIIVIILAIFLPKIQLTEHKEKKNFRDDVKQLTKNHYFVVVSIAIALAMATVSIIAMYNSTIIAELGGTVDKVGLATILQVGSEVIFALFALKLAKRFSHINVMLVAIILLTLQWAIIYLNYHYEVYFWLLWMEGFSTVFLLVVGMDYVKTIVDSKVISTAITSYTAITLLFYFILVNSAGIIRDHFSTKAMFLFLAIITIVSFITLLVFKIIKKDDNKTLDKISNN